MKLIDRFFSWRTRRRHLRHKIWLRMNRIRMPEPDPRARRNSTEAPGAFQ